MYQEKTTCPFCESEEITLEAGMIRVHIEAAGPGEPTGDHVLEVFRCRACGRIFDEDEAGAQS